MYAPVWPSLCQISHHVVFMYYCCTRGILPYSCTMNIHELLLQFHLTATLQIAWLIPHHHVRTKCVGYVGINITTTSILDIFFFSRNNITTHIITTLTEQKEIFHKRYPNGQHFDVYVMIFSYKRGKRTPSPPKNSTAFSNNLRNFLAFNFWHFSTCRETPWRHSCMWTILLFFWVSCPSLTVLIRQSWEVLMTRWPQKQWPEYQMTSNQSCLN